MSELEQLELPPGYGRDTTGLIVPAKPVFTRKTIRGEKRAAYRRQARAAGWRGNKLKPSRRSARNYRRHSFTIKAR